MSFFANIKNRLLGGGDGTWICGVWRVTDISVQHPFGRYVLDLRADGSLEWSSVVPGRRFPGVVIQGDSLSILFDLAMYVTERLPETSGAELRGAARELAEKLFAHVRSYESVLHARGVALPYTRDPGRVPNAGGADVG